VAGKKMSGMLRNTDSFPGQFGQGDISDVPRSLGNGPNTRPTSPLKFFAKAKSKTSVVMTAQEVIHGLLAVTLVKFFPTVKN
jgi:hypothetical protein